MKFWTIASLTVAGVAMAVAYKASRFAYESAPYDEVAKEGEFEIRDYPSLTLVSTPMDDADAEESSSFMRLFRYITGANEANQEISMTTPVFTNRGGAQRRMSFVMPAGVAERDAPRATNEDVRLETMPAGRFAVYRFSGSWKPSRLEEATQKLARWMETRGVEAIGEPIVAGYDPPFTPPMMRRNEVLVRIDDGAAIPALR